MLKHKINTIFWLILLGVVVHSVNVTLYRRTNPVVRWVILGYCDKDMTGNPECTLLGSYTSAEDCKKDLRFYLDSDLTVLSGR